MTDWQHPFTVSLLPVSSEHLWCRARLSRYIVSQLGVIFSPLFSTRSSDFISSPPPHHLPMCCFFFLLFFPSSVCLKLSFSSQDGGVGGGAFLSLFKFSKGISFPWLTVFLSPVQFSFSSTLFLQVYSPCGSTTCGGRVIKVGCYASQVASEGGTGPGRVDSWQHKLARGTWYITSLDGQEPELVC